MVSVGTQTEGKTLSWASPEDNSTSPSRYEQLRMLDSWAKKEKRALVKEQENERRKSEMAKERAEEQRMKEERKREIIAKGLLSTTRRDRTTSEMFAGLSAKELKKERNRRHPTTSEDSMAMGANFYLKSPQPKSRYESAREDLSRHSSN
ncbi:MAG: hypothetical protein M1818_006188 [Claussenomyces sp. TS43310]|nr:MAG: hypothetical protein M1818_006188 [Claussenomyces sp. TS43310]